MDEEFGKRFPVPEHRYHEIVMGNTAQAPRQKKAVDHRNFPWLLALVVLTFK
jgi:hypothetical protein